MGTDAPRSTRHGGRRALAIGLVALLTLTLAAAGFGVFTVTHSFPQTAGTIEIEGLDATVSVQRDASGIPVVTATTAHDLFLAQGFVQAQDRFWEMDFRRHVTAGRLSELFGKSQLETDTFIRTLGWRHVAEQEVELLDPESLAYYEAYADGVNAYLAHRSGAQLSLEHGILALQNSAYSPELWTPADSIAWLKAMAWDLRSNLEDEIDRAILATAITQEEVALLHPAYDYATHPTIVDSTALETPKTEPTVGFASEIPDAAMPSLASSLAELAGTLAALPELLGKPGTDIGSNSWVVSGELTESGLPVLANDPHLGAVLPSVWYQMGLRCKEVTAECPFDVSGFTFSGLPGVIIGHNTDIAWGFTNLGPDVADLYIEKLSADGVEYDGEVEPFTGRTETIRVAGGDDVPLTIRSTRHGPVVSDLTPDFATILADYPDVASLPADEYGLSLQWTALEPGTTPSSIFALNKAHDWASFRTAAELFSVPSQNLIYADIDGNIGYQAPGLIPVRASGNGTLPVPGWTSGFGWTGYLDFEALPTLFNPPRGYIATANNAANNPATSPFITEDWDEGYRADRITTLMEKLLESGEKVTADQIGAMQLDTADPNAAQIVPVLTELPLSGDAALGQQLLSSWDLNNDVDSAGAAYFAVFWRTLLDEMFARKLPEAASVSGGSRWFSVIGTLLEQPDARWWSSEPELGISGRDKMLASVAAKAWKETSELLGTDSESWRWGKLHTLTLTNASFGESGIGPLEALLNRGPYEVGGGSSIVNANGWDAEKGFQVNNVPSMRMVLDLDDWDEARWINLSGASGHAFDPHYVDQAPLWQSGETLPWAFSASAVNAAMRQSLRLRPATD